MQAVVGDFRNSPWSCVQVTTNTGASRYHRLSTFKIGWYHGSRSLVPSGTGDFCSFLIDDLFNFITFSRFFKGERLYGREVFIFQD